MKKTLLTLAFALVQILIFAQAPAIQWQKNLGGTCTDIPNSIQKTKDGGYIVAGYSCSNDTYVTGNRGAKDFWVAKLSPTGSIYWQKSLGGSGDDEASSIQQTTDGGYIVAGTTYSNDGDVTGFHGTYSCDYWVVKLSANGILEWQKTLGGSTTDNATSVQQTTDGGYIVVGNTQSSDGDINLTEETYSSWIVKLDGTGIIQWKQLLTYRIPDWLVRTVISSIQKTADGGYIVGGAARRYNGNYGLFGFFLAKLTATGTTEWYKLYEPIDNKSCSLANSFQQTTDGGYILAGRVYDAFAIPTDENLLVLKLNSIGTIEWEKQLGGSETDIAYSIKQTQDGGYIMAGETSSIDGGISGNHGEADAWVVKLSTTGATEWQKTLGGSLDDYAYDILETASGEYVLAGSSSSIDGDLTENIGNTDLWVVKLGAALSTTSFEKNSVKVYPNPAKNQIILQFPNQLAVDKVSVTDLTGKIILEQTINTTQVNVEKLATGLYLIQAFSGKEKFQSKFIKE